MILGGLWVVSDGFWLVAGGFRWVQVVLDGYRWFAGLVVTPIQTEVLLQL